MTLVSRAMPMLRRLSWPLLVLLPACVLFGPGASGDDDDGDSSGVAPTTSLPRSDSGFGTAGGGAISGSAGSFGEPPKLAWTCTESKTSCKCTRSDVAGPGCEQTWSCCTQTAFDSCECTNNASCTSDFVASCPPPGGPTCAAKNADCSAAHLGQLSGCCDGLVCKDADDGTRTCQTASAEEQALAEQCNSTIPVTSLAAGELKGDMLHSSLGDLPFDHVTTAVLMAGPGGCMSDVMLAVQAGSNSQCSLMLHAGPTLAADHGLKVSAPIDLNVSACPGFAPHDYSSADLQGSLVFDGLRCENSPFGSPGTNVIGDFWCFAGTFELRLDGTLSDPLASETFGDEDAGDGSLSFDHALLRLTGRLCSGVPAMSCPTP